jgi:hypothetical protein
MSGTSRRQKLETMLLADPADRMLRYMLAMELDKEGDHTRSLELLTGLMTEAPAYVPAFVMAGQQLTRLDRISEARSCFTTGIQQAQAQNDAHAAGEMQQFLMSLPS